MCDFDDFDEGIMDENQMPEHDDDLCFDHSEDENIHDDSEHFAPSDESEINMAETAILGGMIFGLAHEDRLDHRKFVRLKKKK